MDERRKGRKEAGSGSGLDLQSMPLVDHHCHALREKGPPLTPEAFRRHFSESRDERTAAHTPTSVFYRRALKDLAEFFHCEADEESVLAARNARPYDVLVNSLLQPANISWLLVDTGYRSSENLSLPEMRIHTGCKVGEVLRLESLAEWLVEVTRDFDEFETRFRERIRTARESGVYSLKTIAAYRGGLRVGPANREAAGRAYAELRTVVDVEGTVRLENRDLLDYLLHAALAEASALELPVQVHTGFGDDDADLREANPLHLRSILRAAEYRDAPIVLLHCWPYTREAGYLAGIYGNLYADLSLTIPFTAHGGAEAILAVLEQAPVSKVLLSTDAFSIPELFHLGARYSRDCLHSALRHLRAESWLTPTEAESTAHALMHENAERLYGLQD